MPHRILILLLLAIACVSAGNASIRAAARPPVVSPTAARIVELINARRARAKLASVRVNTTLMAAAQSFSTVQASLGRLSHRGVDNTSAGQRLSRSGYRWRFFGENLAAGQDTPEAVVEAWMNSPSHRAIVLHGSAREIGIGHTFKPNDPSGYYDYWVLEVGQAY